MINRLIKRVFDILQADARLVQSGTAYGTIGQPAFSGVVRVSAQQEPIVDHVNLIETPLIPDARTSRPAIYRGMKNVEAMDRLDPDMKITVHPSGFLQYRYLIVPLVIVAASNAGQLDADSKRNQLLANVEQILISHLQDDGYWWYLMFSDDLGGRRIWSSAAPSQTTIANQTIHYAESYALLPVRLRYAWKPSSPA